MRYSYSSACPDPDSFRPGALMKVSPAPTIRAVAAACLLTLGLSLAAQAQGLGSEALSAKVGAQVDGMYPQLETLYRDIHSHPELAFQETRTSAKLAGEMRALGFE